jgi:hypothetical protein
VLKPAAAAAPAPTQPETGEHERLEPAYSEG